jgi:hypothetical protein
MIDMLRGIATAVAVLALTGCTPKSRDICTAPALLPPQTKEQIKENYGDQAEQVRVWINSEVDYDNCLKIQAYATRNVVGPMPDVAKGIIAKCSYKFDLWHQMKRGSFHTPTINDSLRAELNDEEEGERQASETQATSLVLDYSTCAAGAKPVPAS